MSRAGSYIHQYAFTCMDRYNNTHAHERGCHTRQSVPNRVENIGGTSIHIYMHAYIHQCVFTHQSEPDGVENIGGERPQAAVGRVHGRSVLIDLLKHPCDGFDWRQNHLQHMHIFWR